MCSIDKVFVRNASWSLSLSHHSHVAVNSDMWCRHSPNYLYFQCVVNLIGLTHLLPGSVARPVLPWSLHIYRLLLIYPGISGLDIVQKPLYFTKSSTEIFSTKVKLYILHFLSRIGVALICSAFSYMMHCWKKMYNYTEQFHLMNLFAPGKKSVASCFCFPTNMQSGLMILVSWVLSFLCISSSYLKGHSH